MSTKHGPVRLAGLPHVLRGRQWDYLELLERIDASGSISAAANTMGMSYKAAWQAVETIQNLSDRPVVDRQTGGRHGGGTQLTPYGRRIVMACRSFEREQARLLTHLNDIMDDFSQYYPIIRRFDMHTSARNQFLGTITALKKGTVNTEVVLDIGSGDELVAIITNDSLEHLALDLEGSAYALIKAPWVIVTTDETLKTSARNQLCGVVVRYQEGEISSEIIIELTGGKLVTAVITHESLHTLDLKEGMRACALIKASHIILAVPYP